jgi:ribosomal-protein-alanine acetyltransferase
LALSVKPEDHEGERQPLRVRLGTATDIPAVLDLEQQCPTAAHWTEHQYQKALREDKTGGRERLVLMVDADREGALPLQPHQPSGLLGFLVARRVGLEWELENIVVAPAARRKGLGVRLLGELLIRAREASCESIFLEVRDSNHAARILYEKLGFEAIGRRNRYYVNPPEDAILYRRRLR